MKKWFWVYVAGFIALTGADVASTILGIAAGGANLTTHWQPAKVVSKLRNFFW